MEKNVIYSDAIGNVLDKAELINDNKKHSKVNHAALKSSIDKKKKVLSTQQIITKDENSNS